MQRSLSRERGFRISIGFSKKIGFYNDKTKSTTIYLWAQTFREIKVRKQEIFRGDFMGKPHLLAHTGHAIASEEGK